MCRRFRNGMPSLGSNSRATGDVLIWKNLVRFLSSSVVYQPEERQGLVQTSGVALSSAHGLEFSESLFAPFWRDLLSFAWDHRTPAELRQFVMACFGKVHQSCVGPITQVVGAMHEVLLRGALGSNKASRKRGGMRADKVEAAAADADWWVEDESVLELYARILSSFRTQRESTGKEDLDAGVVVLVRRCLEFWIQETNADAAPHFSLRCNVLRIIAAVFEKGVRETSSLPLCEIVAMLERWTPTSCQREAEAPTSRLPCHAQQPSPPPVSPPRWPRAARSDETIVELEHELILQLVEVLKLMFSHGPLPTYIVLRPNSSSGGSSGTGGHAGKGAKGDGSDCSGESVNALLSRRVSDLLQELALRNRHVQAAVVDAMADLLRNNSIHTSSFVALSFARSTQLNSRRSAEDAKALAFVHLSALVRSWTSELAWWQACQVAPVELMLAVSILHLCSSEDPMRRLALDLSRALIMHSFPTWSCGGTLPAGDSLHASVCVSTALAFSASLARDHANKLTEPLLRSLRSFAPSLSDTHMQLALRLFTPWLEGYGATSPVVESPLDWRRPWASALEHLLAISAQCTCRPNAPLLLPLLREAWRSVLQGKRSFSRQLCEATADFFVNQLAKAEAAEAARAESACVGTTPRQDGTTLKRHGQWEQRTPRLDVEPVKVHCERTANEAGRKTESVASSWEKAGVASPVGDAGTHQRAESTKGGEAAKGERGEADGCDAEKTNQRICPDQSGSIPVFPFVKKALSDLPERFSALCVRFFCFVTEVDAAQVGEIVEALLQAIPHYAEIDGGLEGEEGPSQQGREGQSAHGLGDGNCGGDAEESTARAAPTARRLPHPLTFVRFLKRRDVGRAQSCIAQDDGRQRSAFRLVATFAGSHLTALHARMPTLLMLAVVRFGAKAELRSQLGHYLLAPLLSPLRSHVHASLSPESKDDTSGGPRSSERGLWSTQHITTPSGTEHGRRTLVAALCGCYCKRGACDG
eukprot:6205996-Pleurochrysis_carterae.AAC.1